MLKRKQQSAAISTPSCKTRMGGKRARAQSSQRLLPATPSSICAAICLGAHDDEMAPAEDGCGHDSRLASTDPTMIDGGASPLGSPVRSEGIDNDGNGSNDDDDNDADDDDADDNDDGGNSGRGVGLPGWRIPLRPGLSVPMKGPVSRSAVYEACDAIFASNKLADKDMKAFHRALALALMMPARKVVTWAHDMKTTVMRRALKLTRRVGVARDALARRAAQLETEARLARDDARLSLEGAQQEIDSLRSELAETRDELTQARHEVRKVKQ